MTWTNLTPDVNSGFTLASSSMTGMYNNFQAICSGDTGAPKINNVAVTTADLGYQSLKTAVGTLTQSAAAANPITITFPSHCFMPSFRALNANQFLTPVQESGYLGNDVDNPEVTVRAMGGATGVSLLVAYRYLIA